MAPSEDPLPCPENQPRRRVRRPRSRRCLLQGCEREFRPQQPLARYCSAACREQARQWRAWKARQRYRQSANGKQKRQAQCRRYRARRKARKKNRSCEQREGHPCKIFFVLLRSSRMLCGVPSNPAITAAAVLFFSLPICSGASSGARAALARAAPKPGETSRRGKGVAPASIKPCRYRLDILHSPRPLS